MNLNEIVIDLLLTLQDVEISIENETIEIEARSDAEYQAEIEARREAENEAEQLRREDSLNLARSRSVEVLRRIITNNSFETVDFDECTRLYDILISSNDDLDITLANTLFMISSERPELILP